MTAPQARKARGLLVAGVCAGLLVACAAPPPPVSTPPPIDWVCLLPEAGGHVGQVLVQGRAGGNSDVLAGAFNTARVAPDGRTRFVQSDAATMEKRYGALLRALPPAP